MTTTKIQTDQVLKEIEPIRTIRLGEDFDIVTRLEGITALWQRFVPNVGQIPGQLPDATYGVCYDHDGALTYSAAVAVDQE